MPAARIDAAMKQELRLLRLRGAYDPKRFYKSFDRTKLPKYFQALPPQVGTAAEGGLTPPPFPHFHSFAETRHPFSQFTYGVEMTGIIAMS
eukprot:363651-Chlamydomonas_euryale.AAC.9